MNINQSNQIAYQELNRKLQQISNSNCLYFFYQFQIQNPSKFTIHQSFNNKHSSKSKGIHILYKKNKAYIHPSLKIPSLSQNLSVLPLLQINYSLLRISILQQSKNMYKQNNKEFIQSQQSPQTSQQTRQNNKLNTYIQQNQLNKNDDNVNVSIRNPLSKKHKTYATVDANNKNTEFQYQLANNVERKMLLLLALSEQFIQTYENCKEKQDETIKKIHDNRRKQFQIAKTSDFKIIEPKKSQNMDLEESYSFFVNIRNGIKQIFRLKSVAEMKKHTQKLIQIYGKDQKQKQNQEDQKENIQHSSKRNINSTFITSDINSVSMSNSLGQVELMSVSNFPEYRHHLLGKSTSQQTDKFHRMKSRNSGCRLRMHPVGNKFELRKKQQIRLFLQLNEKTEHLQNFRSDEGKFFKFNQNLKITIKNVNICRMVLLGKKNAVIQQFDRLGDDGYFKELNQRMSKIKTIPQMQNYKQKHPNKLSQNNSPQSSSLQQFSNHNVFKQKAMRVRNYFQETSRYFSNTESFLLQFIKKQKSYQNYVQENSLKSKLKLYQKTPQKEIFYQDFVDQCFHMSEIARIYFNALTQLELQNFNLKELPVFNRVQLQKQVNSLIQLRYVLIYLQKECQNTTESSFFINTQSSYFNHKPANTQNFNPLFSQQPTRRENKTQMKHRISPTMSPLIKKKTEKGSILRQTLNFQSMDKLKFANMTKISSKIPRSNINTEPVEHNEFPFSNDSSQFDRKVMKKKKISQKFSHCSKDSELDLNEIWKTFYNKKYSSNAMRLRMY